MLRFYFRRCSLGVASTSVWVWTGRRLVRPFMRRPQEDTVLSVRAHVWQEAQVTIYSCSTDTTIHTSMWCRGINKLTCMSAGTVGGRACKFHAEKGRIHGLIHQIFGRTRLYAVSQLWQAAGG